MPSNEIRYHNLVVSHAPHAHDGSSFSGAMYTFIAALAPAAVYAVAIYGVHALRVMTLSMAAAMASEFLIQKLFRQPVSVSDGNSMLTGLLFALILPPGVPWWLVVVGSFVAILVGQQIYGGKGGNPFNPVLVGWAAVRLSWGEYINLDYAMINYRLDFSFEYPLSLLRKAGVAGIEGFNYIDLLLGRQVGGMGSSAVLLIALGGIFLILRGHISWRIPASFLAGVAGTALAFWLVSGSLYADPLFHLLTGNIMIGAFFLATEYSSSPVNKTAMVIYGLGCGFLTVLFRSWSNYPDGVFFAILIMNIVNPLLDKIRPAVPGRDKKDGRAP
ncbi:MAG: RnfABCDGE type electron transport complex subunit D [Spirochaetes bacterium]|nr:RnfABCDGE type electron transport complex subunit D [Spirochaetota bacterium]